MENPSWLKVSLVVDGELAEAVAEVFSRYVPGGVVVEATKISDETNPFGDVVGPLQVSAYLPVDAQLEDTRQKLDKSLLYLGLIQPLPEMEIEIIEQQNWMESWKQHYQPIPAGEKLLIIPAWVDAEEGQRIPIRIDPGMAFGTGAHPTTQLSLRLLETYLQPGQHLFDIGSGSGILSVAGIKLGAAAAYGIDVELQALEMALKTAKENEVAEQVTFEIGSVGDVQAGVFPITQAPVVVANILTHILIRLLEEGIGDLVEESGVLLLSGILEEKEQEIKPVLTKHGFEVFDRIQMDDWLGLAARRKNDN